MKDQSKIEALDRKLKWKNHELNQLIAVRADDLRVPIADIELGLEDFNWPEEDKTDKELRRRWDEILELKKLKKQEEEEGS